MIIIRYLNFCDHLKEIKSEFHGQRMLQIVVTEYHNSLKSHKYLFWQEPKLLCYKIR